MGRYRSLAWMAGMLLGVFLFPTVASANSSWHWISETRPYDVLPVVVVLTLLLETLAINWIPRIRKAPKVFCWVLVGNLLSFAMPYLVWFILCSVDNLYPFREFVENMPVYTVGVSYLVMTLAVELPLVYFSLRKDAGNKRKLLLAIVGANVVTTVLTAVAERVFCAGTW